MGPKQSFLLSFERVGCDRGLQMYLHCSCGVSCTDFAISVIHAHPLHVIPGESNFSGRPHPFPRTPRTLRTESFAMLRILAVFPLS
ncbi:unnamed protein product [Chondrus crispus]|uniref:Uncharacterized protein n=1 Tax=Chondrus crispus TaxID=2769 RepID=S0F348_CHOCR|nr:unnamed protein product [Chondrus crispus]CDF77392.1 unnamed protein product [Chondrus crispus]|eukprot:XP_005712266.1 unnamed protein product [Chondrus crispus]